MRLAGRPRRGAGAGGGKGSGESGRGRGARPAAPPPPPSLAAAASARLDAIRREGLYRTLRGGAVRGSRIVVDGRPLINLASNDYLGMAGPPPLAAAAGDGGRSRGGGSAAPPRGSRLDGLELDAAPGAALGSPGSRLASGGGEPHAALEAALAEHRSAGAALAYPTGYMANIGAVQCLAGPGDAILSDSLNHASMIDACRLSGARTAVYAHNDMGALRAALAAAAKRRRGRTFVLTEGVFSMDGDMAALQEICELASSRGASVVLDDAHGDFVMGASGRGTADELGVQRMIDVHTSSLSKGLGSFGGYVAAASAEVVDLLVNASRAFVYTSALPDAVALHAAGRLGAAGLRERRRRRLESNVRRLGEGLHGAGFNLGADGLRGSRRGRSAAAGPRTTHIMPVMVGSEGAAVDLGRELDRAGVFALPVRYPTVARGAARMRVSVSALLTAADIDHAVDAFAAAGRRLGIL